MRTVVSVTVNTDGPRPSWKEIENRNAAVCELADRNVGKFLWSGIEKGKMDFAFEVHDEQKARTLINKAMFKHLPGWRYAIEATPAKLANTFRMHASGERRRDLERNDFRRQMGLEM